MDIQTKYHSTQGFSLKVVLMIGIQLLDRIKTFHSLGLVHGDIKPANIMFGKGNKKHTLYLIDYGLSKKESVYTKASPPDFVYQKQNLQLNGTPLYASINSHLGWSKMFKKDDMESFIYMLINIYKGKDLDSLN
jgi:serine/threonine protein kinase